jgi:hypothetical protein
MVGMRFSQWHSHFRHLLRIFLSGFLDTQVDHGLLGRSYRPQREIGHFHIIRNAEVGS